MSGVESDRRFLEEVYRRHHPSNKVQKQVQESVRKLTEEETMKVGFTQKEIPIGGLNKGTFFLEVIEVSDTHIIYRRKFGNSKTTDERRLTHDEYLDMLYSRGIL